MELGTNVPNPCWYRRRRFIAGLFACAFGLGVAVIAYASKSSAPSAPQGVPFYMQHLNEIPGGQDIKAALRRADAEFEASRTSNVTAMKLYEYTTECYSFTGGTCRWTGCDSWRNAECHHFWGQGYSCMCGDGSCAGADGKCYQGNYQKLADGVKINNVHWPDERMYFPRSRVLSHVMVSKDADSNGYDDKFNVYAVPGPIKNQLAVLITSTSQPDFVATGMGENVIETWKIDRFWRDMQMVSTILCHPHAESNNYQLGSYSGYVLQKTYWWYLSSMSTGASISSWALGDPGDKGYWTFDPPIVNKASELGITIGQC